MNKKALVRTLATILAALITWGNGVVASIQATISAQEWMGLAMAVGVALGIWRVANGDAPNPKG